MQSSLSNIIVLVIFKLSMVLDIFNMITFRLAIVDSNIDGYLDIYILWSLENVHSEYI